MIWWVLGFLALGGGIALAREQQLPDDDAKLVAKATVANAIRRRPMAAADRSRPYYVDTTVTAAKLGPLVRSAVYIGPLDSPESAAEIEALEQGVDTEAARVALMQIGRDAVALGLDGNPWKIPPREDGNAVEVWNWKQTLVADAIIDLWVNSGTAPGRRDVRVYNHDLLHFAQKFIAHPDCGAFDYFGFSADDIYAKNGVRDCAARHTSYRDRFELALRAWARDEGLLWKPVSWTQWRSELPLWGDDIEQRSMVRYLAPLLRNIAREQMVVWPGGAPTNPQDDSATQAAIVFAIAVAAAAVGGAV